MTRSQQLFEAAQQVMPGGVNSPVRACRSVGTYPRFLEKGLGSHVWDVDGKEYIDLICSWGPLILGHCQENVEQAVAEAIGTKLDRGATFLNGEGSYSHEPTKVVLAAVKKQQVTELKELVMAIDPNAFVIVQEAHQVLGDGFSHYSKQSL